MRVESLVAWMLITPFCSCSDQQAGTSVLLDPADRLGVEMNSANLKRKLMEFDIAQRTCAMYVAVRSRAIDESIAFGRDLDDVKIHWNMCPSGNMVACATVPNANGDSTQVGIPWPYSKTH